MQQDQKELDCLLTDLYQLYENLDSFKDLLGKQQVQKIQQTVKDIQYDRKVLLNVVGNTKIGKSYFCNQLIKVFKQEQIDDIYQLETLFPSQLEQMTSGKVFYQYSKQIPVHQIYYKKISLQDEDEQLIDEQSSYSSLSISNQVKSKQNISLLDFKLLKKIKEDHNTWRSQYQEQSKKKENEKIKQKMESHLSMSKLILNSVGLSKCLKICDHPGLQEQFVAQKVNKQQSNIDRSQISLNSQHTIAKELKEEQKVVQNPENQDEYQYDPNLQFKESQIVVYCMNHTVNNFKDHIKLLYEQNDPELIMFAFNFQRIIEAGKNKKKSILVFYKSMFHNIPEKFKNILEQIIERETKKNKTKFTQQKIQKLKKIKDQLNQYCQTKDKIFAQIISQSPRREQSMSQRIIQKISKAGQKSQIIGKIRYTQDQIFVILKNQKTIPRLMEIYPFKFFHMFGLSGVCSDGVPYEPISQLKKMDEILKKN